MNNLTLNATGIDVELNDFQTDLFNSLNRFINKDSEGNSVVNSYGRIYKNEKVDGGAVPEWFNNKNENYEEMYLDSSKKVVFYFLVGDNHTSEDGSFFTTPIKVVFMFNLKWIKTPNRADAEVQKIATTSIKKDVDSSFDITGIETGIANVFTGFDVSKIKFDDMQPFHTFSVNGNIGYYLNQNC